MAVPVGTGRHHDSADNANREKKNVGLWLLLLGVAAAGLVSCDGGSTPSENDQEPDATEIFPGFTVSDAEEASGTLMANAEGVAYVSASPGTFSDADRVTLTNLATGESQTLPLVEGGFDPVPLKAQPGDEIEIIVHHNDGSTSRHLTRVPKRKRPRVVRTMPPKDATDVVLSASVMVVFSEPVDPSTVTTENVRLETNGAPVAGTLTVNGDGLWAVFMPDEPLNSLSTYTLVVSTAVLDLEGDPLEEEVVATFKTQSSLERATIELCAKQAVIEQINQIEESSESGWEGPIINSTEPACGVTDGPYEPYAPHGTFTYRIEGPRLEWSFVGTDLVSPQLTDQGVYVWHIYMLVLIPDGPWPARDLTCIGKKSFGSGIPRNGVVSMAGSLDLSADLVDAKIWLIPRFRLGPNGDLLASWSDCTGSQEQETTWPNPDGVPRLTNDQNADGSADASASLIDCWPHCDWGAARFYYDWLFETSLINYRDTDG